MTLHGIGGGPLDEVVPRGEWRGPGPITQAAIFERQPAADELAASGTAAAALAPAMAPPAMEQIFPFE